MLTRATGGPDFKTLLASIEAIDTEEKAEAVKAKFIRFIQTKIKPAMDGLYAGKDLNDKTKEEYEKILQKLNEILANHCNIHVLDLQDGQLLTNDDYEYIEPVGVEQGNSEQSETM